MAAAELSSERELARVSPRAWASRWIIAYCATWLATATSGLIVTVGGTALRNRVRAILVLHVTSATNASPGVDHVVGLAAHNLAPCAWPVLLGALGAHRTRLRRGVFDAVVLIWLLANTAPVGAALATYGARLLPYVPQLPVEWAAFALGGSAWLMQRRRSIAPREGVVLVGSIAVLLICAATLETFAVPHR